MCAAPSLEFHQLAERRDAAHRVADHRVGALGNLFSPVPVKPMTTSPTDSPQSRADQFQKRIRDGPELAHITCLVIEFVPANSTATIDVNGVCTPD